MLVMCSPSSSIHANRTLHNNQLAALDVGLFDKNTALDTLCVDQGGAGGVVGLERNAREALRDGKVVGRGGSRDEA